MSISHRTNRLKLIGAPAVEQLQNGRYQLTVNCTTINSRDDWYSANKARIFPDFGSLESAEMSIDGLAPRTGEAYTDMRLVAVQSSTQQEKYIVTLVYQTLGASFVQVKDDTVSYVENGLRRVTRKSIAKAGTDFQKTIGTTSITSQIDSETAVTCVLANYEVDDTDSYREVTEVYIEAGTLSETEDKVGSQLSIVKETFASTPSTPSGYSIANEQESNVDGISTKRFTFLKNNVVLSETEDKVGSQLAIVKEVFNGTPSTPSGYSIANEQESNVDGISTKRFTFLKPSILNLDTPLIGGQQRVKVLAFSLTSSEVDTLLSEVTEDHKLIDSSVSNYQGIKTSQYTFEVDDFETTSQESNGLKVLIRTELSTTNFTDGDIGIDRYKTLTLSGEEIDNGNTIKKRTSLFSEHGLLNESRGNASNGIRNVSKTFLGTEESVNGPITSRTVQNVNGIKTITVNFVEGEDGTEITGVSPGQLVKQSTSLELFNLPGLVRLMKSEGSGGVINSINYSFELTGPIQTKVPTTNFILYQTSSSINEATDYTYNSSRALWNPGGWAKSRTSGLDIKGKPFSLSKAYRGYRAPETFEQFDVTQGKLTLKPYPYGNFAQYFFQQSTITHLYIDGYQMSSLTPPTIALSGGPENPVGRRYVTDVSIEPSFTDVDGVQYYKKTIKVADVEGDQIDDALSSDYKDNMLGAYTTTGVGSNFSIKLDDSFQAEDNYYTGFLFNVYPRNKDSGNHFTTTQRMIVYDYRSDTNSILIGSDINSGNAVGLYETGDVGTNASYEFARMDLTTFVTSGSILNKISIIGFVFMVSEGLSQENSYAGWQLKFTSGTLNTVSFQIVSSFTNKFRLSGMSNTQYGQVNANDTFELVAPASFP